MASPLADFVVSIGADGCIASQGSVSETLAKDSKLVEEFKHEEEAIELDENEDETEANDSEVKDGKLIVAEEVEEGHVSIGACKFCLSSVNHQAFSDFAQSHIVLPGVGGEVANPVLDPLYLQ